MKRIFLAAVLGLGIISFSMAGGNHATAPVDLTRDTVPSDSVPAPTPDTTSLRINQ